MARAKANTEIVRFALDDGEKQAATTATATAKDKQLQPLQKMKGEQDSHWLEWLPGYGSSG